MQATTPTERPRWAPGRPSGPRRTGPDGLTDRQRLIIEAIQESVSRHGYPPSVREIGTAVGLESTSSVYHHLRQLERMGILRRDRSKGSRPRAYSLTISVSRNSPPPQRCSHVLPMLRPFTDAGAICAELGADPGAVRRFEAAAEELVTSTIAAQEEHQDAA